MLTLSTARRRATIGLCAAAVLIPTTPAFGQTVPSSTPTRPPTPAPAPIVPISIDVVGTVIEHGKTHALAVFGPVGARVQLFGNGELIRSEALASTPDLKPGRGLSLWELQPGDRTQYYAVVNGVRTRTVTVEVRRTVTIGISQANGIYTFTGQVARAEAGLQVTIARLASETNRITGVASTRTDVGGRYVLRTALPQGLSGYLALTGVTNVGNLQPGRSRLYGLLVNTRPALVV